jgi:hypothetical protein
MTPSIVFILKVWINRTETQDLNGCKIDRMYAAREAGQLETRPAASRVPLVTICRHRELFAFVGFTGSGALGQILIRGFCLADRTGTGVEADADEVHVSIFAL